ncbi:MAG: hypothetical protein RL272_336 [Candidatus Parcubacteria bacterium]
MKTYSFERLKIWKEAYELSLEIYGLTGRFPAHETYGLSSQLRRAAVSIAANIAEGAGRNTGKEFANFLHIAEGSINETVCHCMLARDLGYIGAGRADALIRRYTGLRAGVFAYITAIQKTTV